MTEVLGKTTLFAGCGGRSSAWLEPQIVDLAVAGSNPVDHPILRTDRRLMIDRSSAELSARTGLFTVALKSWRNKHLLQASICLPTRVRGEAKAP